MPRACPGLDSVESVPSQQTQRLLLLAPSSALSTTRRSDTHQGADRLLCGHVIDASRITLRDGRWPSEHIPQSKPAPNGGLFHETTARQSQPSIPRRAASEAPPHTGAALHQHIRSAPTHPPSPVGHRITRLRSHQHILPMDATCPSVALATTSSISTQRHSPREVPIARSPPSANSSSNQTQRHQLHAPGFPSSPVDKPGTPAIPLHRQSTHYPHSTSSIRRFIHPAPTVPRMTASPQPANESAPSRISHLTKTGQPEKTLHAPTPATPIPATFFNPRNHA